MSKKVELGDVLIEYYHTKNQSLIDQEVYNALTAFCVTISKKYAFDNPKYYDTDELMSVCNSYIWKNIWSYNPDKKSNMISFLYTIIKNAILMDVRRDKALKRAKCLYIEDMKVGSDSNKEVTVIDIMPSDSSYDIEKHIFFNCAKEIINDTLTNIKNKSAKESLYYRIHEIMDLCMFQEVPNKEIAKKYNVSHSYINRMVRDTKAVIVKDLKRNGFNL